MEAQHRKIENWMNDIIRGRVRLPRFQRSNDAWSQDQIELFLEAVLRQHPLGVFLILDVSRLEQSPFETRAVTGTFHNGERCAEHLLDGQQRMIALFRSFEDNYDKHTYYVKFNHSDNASSENGVLKFDRVEKSLKTAKCYQNPSEEYKANLIPVSILAPSNEKRSMSFQWKNELQLEEIKAQHLDFFISSLREIISGTKIPYLSIPSDMAGQAVDIFININTSFTKLSPFDIAAACCEKELAESLRDHYIEEIVEDHELFTHLEGRNAVGETILKISCVMQNMPPKKENYKKLNFNIFKENWESLRKGIRWTEEFLKHQGISGIQDRRWLPSKVPLRVLPALQLDEFRRFNSSSAANLMRAYLWRAFLTKRYTRQVDDRLFQDYKTLKGNLEVGNFESFSKDKNSIFNEKEYKLPEIDDLMEERWPTEKGILKKAILAVCVHNGANGLETNSKITIKAEKNKREYHHIFPKATWSNESECNHALNCMMLEAAANRSWRDAWPSDYISYALGKMGEDTNKDGNENEEILKKRLETHMLPAEYLMHTKEKETMEEKKEAYEEFLRKRAEIVLSAMRKLYQGEEI